MPPGFLSRLVNRARENPLVGDLNPTDPTGRGLRNKIFGDRLTSIRFTPEAYEKIRSEYLPSIGLGKDVTFSAEAFNNHAKGRVNDYKGIAAAKMPPPSEETILKKLTLSDATPVSEDKKKAITAVQNDINSVVTPKKEFDNAKNEYAASVATFTDLVAQVPDKYKAEDLIGAMKDIVDTGKKAIADQQKLELSELEKKFSDPESAFIKNLKTALDISSQNEIDHVKKSMLDDLKATQAKQMEEFDKSTQESLTKLHQAAQKQMKEFLFLADLHKNDPEMRAMIERLAAANRANGKDANAPVTVDLTSATTKVSSVSLDQLEFLKRLGGEKITIAKDEQGKTTYTLDMGMRMFNPRYYYNDHDKKDMQMIAQAIRASGASGITMNIDFKNPKIAEQRARDAFEACIKAGFPPDKITLKVNGVPMRVTAEDKKFESIKDKLFSKKTANYEALIDSSKSLQDKYEKLTKLEPTPPGEGLNKIKSAISDMRTKAKEKEKAALEKEEPKKLNISA